MFGRSILDKNLEQQRATLSDHTERLKEFQQRFAMADLLAGMYGPLWPSEGIPADLSAKVRKADELHTLLAERMAMARKELPNFDEALQFLGDQIPLLEQRWDAFLAIMLGRHAISEKGGNGASATVFDCQLVLCDELLKLHGDLQRRISDFEIYRTRTGAPWPRDSNGGDVKRGMNDVSGAVAVYRDRLNTTKAALPEVSSASMMQMIGTIENSIRLLDEQRQNHAVHLAIKAASHNSGLY